MPTIETAKLRALQAEHDRLTREIELRDRRIAELEKDIAPKRKNNRQR